MKLRRRARTSRVGLPKRCWRVEFELKCPRLAPPAVQVAIMDRDPVPELKARMYELRLFHKWQLGEATSDKDRARLRSIFMAVTWNAGFKNVSGDDVWLLTSVPGETHSSMSNLPDGRKWVVTKSATVEGRPICWCIPVEVCRGRAVQVTLRESNAFDLRKTYSTVMSQAARRKSSKLPNRPDL